MESPAQTNAQLFLQIQERGCSSAELRLVRDAYTLAMQLYSGLFTGSGKPTLTHEVGTASLAHRHGGSFDLIAAGLLHGAYLVGDWGHAGTRLREENRQAVRRVVGPRAEAYVHGVALLRWDAPSIAALAERADALTELERGVVFVKLVEELDHLCDYGAILWFRDAPSVKATLREQRAHVCRLATRLGYPDLSAEFEQTIDLTLTSELPAEILGLELPTRTTPLLLIPQSCRRRWLLHLDGTLYRHALQVSDGVWRRLSRRAWSGRQPAMRVPRRGFVNRAARAIRRRLAPPATVRLEHGRVLDNQLLAGRNALVTGAGRNIGRSIALEMAQQGANVYFTDRDPASLSRLQSELEAVGARARGFVSDVSKPSDVERLCGALQADGVGVDVLVNNVGIGAGEGIRDLQIADVRAVFETNVFGPLQLTQHVVNALVAAGRSGSVLFLTSVHERATHGSVAYSASKAALAMVVRELALELAPHRIRVNGIAPGGVFVSERDELPPFEGSALLGSYIHPSYIGRAAVYLAADYFSQFTTGSVLTVDAGLLSRPQHR